MHIVTQIREIRNQLEKVKREVRYASDAWFAVVRSLDQLERAVDCLDPGPEPIPFPCEQ